MQGRKGMKDTQHFSISYSFTPESKISFHNPFKFKSKYTRPLHMYDVGTGVQLIETVIDHANMID